MCMRLCVCVLVRASLCVCLLGSTLFWVLSIRHGRIFLLKPHLGPRRTEVLRKLYVGVPTRHEEDNNSVPDAVQTANTWCSTPHSQLHVTLASFFTLRS